MTISSNIRKAGPFVGNGTASNFAFTFKVFQAADLEVVRLNVSTTIETVLVINSDYTVSLNADQNSNPGGSITLTAGALASGFNLVITSDIENLQPTDIVNQGGFYPEVIEDALDRATIQIQQLQEAVDRSAKLPITSSADADALVADIVALANDQANIDIVAANIGDVNTVAADIADINTVATDIADVNTVAANIADVTTAADNIAAIIAAPTEASNAAASASLANEWATKTSGPVAGGEYSAKYNAQQAASSASTATTQAGIATTQAGNASSSASAAAASESAAAASAAAAAASYDNFDDRYLGSKASAPTVDNDGNPLVVGALYYNNGTAVPADKGMYVYDGSVWIPASAASEAILTTFKYTATAGQTSFSGPDDGSQSLTYTVGSVIITLNGVVMEVPADVTASTGTSVVLSVAAAAGDELNIYAFATFSVANTYTQAQADAKFAQVAANNTFTKAQRGSITALTDGATITPDFSANNHFEVTLGGNRTLANPSNVVAGQSGVIRVVQDGTGSRTLAYGSNFKFSNGAAPVLTTTANAVDLLVYFVESSSRIAARLVSDVK